MARLKGKYRAVSAKANNQMSVSTSLSNGELIYEFFILPTLRIEKRPDRFVFELCWLNKYIGVVRNYWWEEFEKSE